MKNLILVLSVVSILCLSACTTMRTVDIPNDQLSMKIESDRVIKVGQKINVITTGGKTHNFIVTRITPEKIIGDKVEVPINEISALSTEHFSAGKTTTAVVFSIIAVTFVLTDALKDDLEDAFTSN